MVKYFNRLNKQNLPTITKQKNQNKIQKNQQNQLRVLKKQWNISNKQTSLIPPFCKKLVTNYFNNIPFFPLL